MYQLLKYEFASGPYNIVGAIIIPGIAIGALDASSIYRYDKRTSSI